jgi:hypothetical protein
VKPELGLSVACVVVIDTSIPMILGKVPPNRLYGFRTRLTLSSPDVWYPANRFAGRALTVGALVSLAGLQLLPDAFLANPLVSLAVFVVPLVAAMLASLAYVRRFAGTSGKGTRRS